MHTVVKGETNPTFGWWAVLEGESVCVPKLLPSSQFDMVAQKLPTWQHSAT